MKKNKHITQKQAAKIASASRYWRDISARFSLSGSIAALRAVWVLNVLLVFVYMSIFIGPAFLRSSVMNYSDVKADPFDGAIYPITYIPNWLNAKNTLKSLKYEDISVDQFIEMPKYDTTLLANEDKKNKDALIQRFTYITPYMGSYRMNYEENDGSHLAVDIRAPLGTPVLSVANGVVTKVKDTETGDGKYVIIRHDNVPLSGTTETVYSAYEHLADITAVEGTKIKRGELLGHVGMTGITTTPHLHFQIDRADAPSHPYWPYSFKDASDAGLDFFGAVNVGLGKENAIRYTIHPLEFIQNNLNNVKTVDLKEISVASEKTPENLNSAPEEPVKVEPVKPVVTETPAVTPEVKQPETVTPAQEDPSLATSLFSLKDVTPGSKYYTAVNALVEEGVVKGYADGNFYPDRTISRREALIIIFRLFDVTPDATVSANIFKDVKKDDILKPYLDTALDRGIVKPNSLYRPDDTVTRAELVSLMLRTSGLTQDTDAAHFDDVSATSGHYKYIGAFSRIMGISGGKFNPDVTMDRGGVANVLYTFGQKIGKIN